MLYIYSDKGDVDLFLTSFEPDEAWLATLAGEIGWRVEPPATDAVVHHAGGKRVAFDGASASSSSTGVPPSAATGNAAIDGIRNFGNTINPLNHIPGMIRGFGRIHSESSTPPLQSAASASTAIPERLRSTSIAHAESSSTNVGSAAIRDRVDPPIKRFLEIDDALDLKLGDVAELLEDYKRLAAVLASLDN